MGTSYVGPEPGRLFCTECGSQFASEDLARFGSSAVCANCKPRFLQRLKEGVTPVSGFEYGGFWRRFVAILIDSIILTIALLPFSMLLMPMAVQTHPGQQPTIAYGFLGITYLLDILVACAYFGYFYSQKSATPGKMVMGLKVITADGGRLSWGRSIGRLFASYLSGMILCIGYIIAAFDPQKRALHDYICNTRVIKA
jgi:uncharacterized RDD family membrane protein YckC